MGQIIYNVTVKVDKDVEDDWISWMRQTHIPEVIATGLFESHTVMKLRHPMDDEGATYAVQYRCAGMESLDRYISDHATGLQKTHLDRYGQRAVSYRTILEIVD